LQSDHQGSSTANGKFKEFLQYIETWYITYKKKIPTYRKCNYRSVHSYNKNQYVLPIVDQDNQIQKSGAPIVESSENTMVVLFSEKSYLMITSIVEGNKCEKI